MFGKFKLVLVGHIHKKQELGSNILFPGATNQQRSSDSKGTFGYYKIYSDLTYKFIELKTPIFRFYKEESEIDNDTDYWVKTKDLKIIKEEVEDVEIETTDKTSIAKEYMKSEGIKSKRKRRLLIKYLNK